MTDDRVIRDLRTHRLNDRQRLDLYRRDDHLGQGPALSLWHDDTEVMRLDLFPEASHEHRNTGAIGLRNHHPPAFDWRRRVELALSDLVLNAERAAEGCPHVETPAFDHVQLDLAARWARERLLRPLTFAIIACGGDGERWGNYGGVPKHLWRTDGDTLLGRLARQCRDLGWRPIVLVGDEADVTPYQHAAGDAEVVVIDPDDAPGGRWLDLGKVMSSRRWWHPTGRTLLLFGDVWFTDHALGRLDVDTLPHRWSVAGRPGPHPLVGTPWHEAFGFGFWAHHHAEIEAAAERLIGLRRAEVTDGASLWHLYRALLGLPDDLLGRNLAGEHLTLVADWTADFDLPDDAERWRRARSAP